LKKRNKIIEHETSWPGSYSYFKTGLRDRHSDFVGGDFFGYPELTGGMTGAYNEIVDSILDTVSKKGFDISGYKDKDGKLTINAERIETLLVGDVINVKSKDGEKKTEEKQDKSDNGKQSMKPVA